MDVKLLGLDETSSVAYNSSETQTSNYFVYFSVAIDWQIPRKRVAKGARKL